MIAFQKTDRGLIHIKSPEVWHLHLQVTQSSQRRTRNHSAVYHSEFEVVQPFERQHWVTDASINTTTGLITVPTVAQDNMLKCSHHPQPQINLHMWQHFENYIKSTADEQQGCIFNAIIGDLPVRHWRFNNLCNLLLDETPIFISTDGLVRADLRSASCSWLF